MKKVSDRGLKEGKVSLEALIVLKLAKLDFVKPINYNNTPSNGFAVVIFTS